MEERAARCTGLVRRGNVLEDKAYVSSADKLHEAKIVEMIYGCRKNVLPLSFQENLLAYLQKVLSGQVLKMNKLFGHLKGSKPTINS